MPNRQRMSSIQSNTIIRYVGKEFIPRIKLKIYFWHEHRQLKKFSDADASATEIGVLQVITKFSQRILFSQNYDSISNTIHDQQILLGYSKWDYEQVKLVLNEYVVHGVCVVFNFNLCFLKLSQLGSAKVLSFVHHCLIRAIKTGLSYCDLTLPRSKFHHVQMFAISGL